MSRRLPGALTWRTPPLFCGDEGGEAPSSPQKMMFDSDKGPLGGPLSLSNMSFKNSG
jgi:hypothetical protein